MRNAIEFVEIRCKVERSTEKALLVIIDDKKYWIAKSICNFEYDSNEGTLTAPTWWKREEHVARPKKKPDPIESEPDPIDSTPDT